ncbi:hypothetical protein D3C87_1749620 [compost metagenome]
MKKIAGILGVVAIAAAMFLTDNVVSNSFADTSLPNLISINSANAEAGGGRYNTNLCVGNGAVWSACTKPDPTGPCDREKTC